MEEYPAVLANEILWNVVGVGGLYIPTEGVKSYINLSNSSPMEHYLNLASDYLGNIYVLQAFGPHAKLVDGHIR